MPTVTVYKWGKSTKLAQKEAGPLAVGADQGGTNNTKPPATRGAATVVTETPIQLDPRPQAKSQIEAGRIIRAAAMQASTDECSAFAGNTTAQQETPACAQQIIRCWLN